MGTDRASSGREGAAGAAAPAESRWSGEGALWFALLGGAAAWTAHLLAMFTLTFPACEAGRPGLLHLITAAALLPALAATWTGRRARAEWSSRRGGEDDGLAARREYMATLGMILSGFFVVVIVAEGMPVLFDNLCSRAP